MGRNANATACGATALLAGGIILAAASGSWANVNVGISPGASLQELYDFLDVEAPIDGNWTPIPGPVDCSNDWVVWTNGPDDPTDPSPPPELRVCLGRWRATNSDRCRDEARCGCELFNECRQARDSCDVFPGQCKQVLYQTTVPINERGRENVNCRIHVRDFVRSLADGGPYHYRWPITAVPGFNFVCQAQYMVAPRVRAPQCGCQTANMCECAAEQLASATFVSQSEGLGQMIAQKDPEDVLGPMSCETLQEQAGLSATTRYAALTNGLAMFDPASRTAFAQTRRLVHEIDMVRPTAQELVNSDHSLPQCGVRGWLSVSTSCHNQVPAAPRAASNNCARLLSSHVRGPTITEDVFRLCTDALRTISTHPYSDPVCGQNVKDQVAPFATALRNKAIGLAFDGIAGQEVDR